MKKIVLIWMIMICMLAVGCTTNAEGEKAEETPLDYRAKNMLQVWHSFVSNLSGRQRKMMWLLYVLVVCALVAIVYFFCYWAGYVIGEFIANVQNGLNR